MGEPSELQRGARASAAAPGSRRRRSARPRTARSRTGASTRSRRWPGSCSGSPRSCPISDHPLTGRPTVNAALITGGSAPNVVPDRCEVDIDRRISPGETDPEQVRAPFLALVERPPAGRIPSVRDRASSFASGPTPPRPRPTPTSSGLARDAVAAETGVDTGARRVHRHHGRPLLHQPGDDPHRDPGARLAHGGAHRQRVGRRWTNSSPRRARYARIFAAFLAAEPGRIRWRGYP